MDGRGLVLATGRINSTWAFFAWSLSRHGLSCSKKYSELAEQDDRFPVGVGGPDGHGSKQILSASQSLAEETSEQAGGF
jgi:hypothetical protein